MSLSDLTTMKRGEKKINGQRRNEPMTDARLLYESSNGDLWFLTRDPVSGAPTVMHQPNLKSGGQASYIEIGKFLREGASGPEHQALLHLIETLIGG